LRLIESTRKIHKVRSKRRNALLMSSEEGNSPCPTEYASIFSNLTPRSPAAAAIGYMALTLCIFEFFSTLMAFKGFIPSHTASHIIASIAYNKYGALITGGNITPEYAKDDFDVEKKEVLQDIVSEANEVARRGIEVKVLFLSKEEALKIPGVVKLAERMPPEQETWRIVEIPGVDVQADGGPHVKNTGEIGTIETIKVENRGKGRKRLYYTVRP